MTATSRSPLAGTVVCWRHATASVPQRHGLLASCWLRSGLAAAIGVRRFPPNGRCITTAHHDGLSLTVSRWEGLKPSPSGETFQDKQTVFGVQFPQSNVLVRLAVPTPRSFQRFGVTIRDERRTSVRSSSRCLQSPRLTGEGSLLSHAFFDMSRNSTLFWDSSFQPSCSSGDAHAYTHRHRPQRRTNSGLPRRRRIAPTMGLIAILGHKPLPLSATTRTRSALRTAGRGWVASESAMVPPRRRPRGPRSRRSLWLG